MSVPDIHALVLLVVLATPIQSWAQQAKTLPSPVMASGTLNLVLANKNGFVIAADSRMSSEVPAPCEGKRQLYCDNSQKLFRTTPNSAMAIAGFAVGQFNSPLDLAVASVIRKQFGSSRWLTDDHADAVPSTAEGALEDALAGVAALFDPAKTPAQSLSLSATFVRFDTERVPIIEQKIFSANWKPTGAQNALTPEYNVVSGRKKVAEFFALPVGITCVADAILAGHYTTMDSVIQNYYRMRTNRAALDEMTIEGMVALAKAILAETQKFTDLVGGDAQIGSFPASGNVQWSLPANLPSEAKLQPRVYRFSGLTCSDSSTPPCGFAPVSFFVSSQQPPEEVFKKFFLASRFIRIPVALDNNLFVGSTFDHVTLRSLGGSFFMLRNIYNDCVLELPEGVELPPNSELVGKCTVESKTNIDVYTIVGARPQMMADSSTLSLSPMKP
jgi:hypothetical protein